jgi:phosphoenolpyruvate carboxykinase (ATP)
MLGERLLEHGVSTWLVNTGWIGGPYGVGKRMSLPHTRALLRGALSGALDGVGFVEHPVFRVQVPQACPDVPARVLDARAQWTDPAAYDHAARDLAGRFRRNFEKFSGVSEQIRRAEPAG